jgi:hypothetical protein
MIQILDGIARSSNYLWPSNAYLVSLTKKCSRSIQLALDELERAGWITRVFTPEAKGSGRPRRLGIILLKRTDPEFPVADTEAKIAAAESAIRDRAASKQPKQRDNGRKMLRSGGRKKLRSPCVQDVAHGSRDRSEGDSVGRSATYSAHIADDRRRSSPTRRVSGARLTAKKFDQLLLEEAEIQGLVAGRRTDDSLTADTVPF